MENREIPRPMRHSQFLYVPITTDPFSGHPIDWNVHPDHIPTERKNLPFVLEEWQQKGATAYSIVRSKIFNIPRDLEEYTKTLEWITNLKLYGCGDIHKEIITEKKDAGGNTKEWTVWLVWIEVRGYIPR